MFLAKIDIVCIHLFLKIYKIIPYLKDNKKLNYKSTHTMESTFNLGITQ
jgi:hypothetical protein